MRAPAAIRGHRYKQKSRCHMRRRCSHIGNALGERAGQWLGKRQPGVTPLLEADDRLIDLPQSPSRRPRPSPIRRGDTTVRQAVGQHRMAAIGAHDTATRGRPSVEGDVVRRAHETPPLRDALPELAPEAAFSAAPSRASRNLPRRQPERGRKTPCRTSSTPPRSNRHSAHSPNLIGANPAPASSRRSQFVSRPDAASLFHDGTVTRSNHVAAC